MVLFGVQRLVPTSDVQAQRDRLRSLLSPFLVSLLCYPHGWESLSSLLSWQEGSPPPPPLDPGAGARPLHRLRGQQVKTPRRGWKVHISCSSPWSDKLRDTPRKAPAERERRGARGLAGLGAGWERR